MINVKKIKAAMVESGYTQRSLSSKIGISKNTLNLKLNGKSAFSVDEAALLCSILNITDEKDKALIFFTASIPK